MQYRSAKYHQLSLSKVAKLKELHTSTLQSCFGSTDPSLQLFIRVFKVDGELELWVNHHSTFWQLHKVMPLQATSGNTGPKRKEGDGQIPEGIYTITHFNPESKFHLSLRINYPNASDLLLADKVSPGSDIYIHGEGSSRGCVVLSNDEMEWLYLLAVLSDNNSGTGIPVHIFPQRKMKEEGSDAFTIDLKKIADHFDQQLQLPNVRVSEEGRYVIKN